MIVESQRMCPNGTLHRNIHLKARHSLRRTGTQVKSVSVRSVGQVSLSFGSFGRSDQFGWLGRSGLLVGRVGRSDRSLFNLIVASHCSGRSVVRVGRLGPSVSFGSVSRSGLRVSGSLRRCGRSFGPFIILIDCCVALIDSKVSR